MGFVSCNLLTLRDKLLAKSQFCIFNHETKISEVFLSDMGTPRLNEQVQPVP